jgi:hypothetical protein
MGEFACQAQRDTFSFRSRERFMAGRGLRLCICGVMKDRPRRFLWDRRRGQVHLDAHDAFCGTGFSREEASPGTIIAT